MKALVKSKRAAGLWMEDVAMPTIKDDEVLIKIKKTAICGTDIHIYKWDEWAQKTIPTPLTIGHEFMGEIVELGPLVTGFKIGDRVSGEGHITCKICRNCRTGQEHICSKTKGIGIHRNGAFAEFLSIPSHNVFKVPESISDEVAAIFDPFGNAVHSALSFPLTGEDVLITGAGPIGIMAAGVATQAGAHHVVITDVNEYRLDIARKMGIESVVNISKTTIEETMEKLHIKEGFTVGLEMSGNPHGFNSLLEFMQPGGQVALLGILPYDTQVDWDFIIFKGLNLKGIYGRKMFDTWYKMVNLLEGKLDLSPLITHRFSIDEFEKGFDVMASGQSGKVILEWPV